MRASTTLILMMLSSLAMADLVVPIEEVESYVRIRSAPDASAEAISRLHRSKPRPHVETLDGWYEVELENGTSGFVSSDWSVLVNDDGQGASEASEATEADEAATVPDPEPVVEAVQESPESLTAESPAEQPSATGESAEQVPPKQPSSAPETTDEKPSAAAVAAEPVADKEAAEEIVADSAGQPGPAGPKGPQGPMGPQGPPGNGGLKGTHNFLVKFKKPTIGGNSQIFDDGNRVGIGTVEPEQRLDVNGSLQIHDRTSAVAGVMITQIRGETGYILHNQASTLTIGAGSVDRITIDKDGNIGFGVNRPEYPLQLASGAYVSAGGVWTNSSSRARKANIDSLTLEAALAALAELEPVEFNYLSDAEEKHLGFIAEDVPDLVATTDRRSLSPMDIVAVLTRVVQEQQERIQSLEQRIAEQN